MLKKKNRIRLNKDFDQVFKNGQSFYTDIFGLKLAKNDLDRFRLGILLNTKVSKKATERNKLKRQIRELVRQEMPNIKKGYDLVIIVLPKIIEVDFSDIKESLKTGFNKIGLYR